MKTIACALAAGAALMAFAAPALAGEVRVVITGVEARGGNILATLQTEGQFMQGRGEYGEIIPSPAAPGSITVVFPDVAPGEYALSVMHDANNNQQMEMLPSGMPAEGYAMSNSSRLRGPPTFPVVKFTVGAEPVSLREEIYYPYVPPSR